MIVVILPTSYKFENKLFFVSNLRILVLKLLFGIFLVDISPQSISQCIHSVSIFKVSCQKVDLNYFYRRVILPCC